MKRHQIIVVDDDETILELVTYNLVKNGYDVVPLEDGRTVMNRIQQSTPDLVLLDWMLPESDGLELCQNIKRDHPDLPVFMFSARGEDNDIIEGLNKGADDYIPKPFSVPVLIARIKSLLNKQKRKETSEELTSDKLYMHFGKHKAYLDGQELNLTKYEFTLLAILARRPGRLFERHTLLEAMEGRILDNPSMDRTIDVHIAAIRKKMKPYQHYIETVRGMGYRFREQ